MLKQIATTDPGFRRKLASILKRGEQTDGAADGIAREIIAAVRKRGDKALLEYTARFDGVQLSPAAVRVPDADLKAAERAISPVLRKALRLAAKRIESFHRRQVDRSWSYRDAEGFLLGQQITPLRRVGVYVPGGHGAYPSSVLMSVIPARVAGVEDIVMVSPAGADGYNPAVLAAASIAKVSSVYRIGGAQAVAALAYGTATVPAVDKIIGPGNAYVQAAKKLVYGQVDIDKIAGPSEVVVIADGKANPAWVAADLLAQAEHGSGDESAVLLTSSKKIARQVGVEVEKQLAELPRRAAIARVLRRRGAIVHVKNIAEAIDIAEEIAPEHLELQVRDARRWAKEIRNSGAIFMGDYAPAPLGDYMAGPNHVLPTGGSARFFSPLGVYDFVKRTSIVGANRSALAKLAGAISDLALEEGYTAHSTAVASRFHSK